MKKTMLRIAGNENHNSLVKEVNHRKAFGTQVGVIVLGEGNEGMIDDANNRGLAVDASNPGFVTIHKTN